MVLLNQFKDYLLLEKKYALLTVDNYERDIIQFFKYLDIKATEYQLKNIDYGSIRLWIVNLIEEGISNRTVNRKIASLKAFFKFLVKVQIIESSPLLLHKMLKEPKKSQVPFSLNEIENVLDKYYNQNDFESTRNYLIILLLYTTGIRRSELINLKDKDIDFENSALKVLGKRNKERYVPLLNSVKEVLSNYLELKTKLYSSCSTEYVFITKKGVKVYETLVYRIVEQLICNQQVVGSSPSIGSCFEKTEKVIKSVGEIPSGQRGQTVNPLVLPSQVRILLSPLNYF